jgi:hypothetical protein
MTCCEDSELLQALEDGLLIVGHPDTVKPVGTLELRGYGKSLMRLVKTEEHGLVWQRVTWRDALRAARGKL